MKKHTGFILFFSFIIFLFLGKLIFMKAAFLAGDYLVQFYPWSKIYSEAIKNFTFPFWTGFIGSGFPLMAEGQIGGFYPLNLIMFFFLPFNIAYNYSIILHFILAGVFTYIYTRSLGADEWGGALAALLFCFGSSFAGCPYLRTLTWFPLVLFIFEKYFENKKIKYLFSAGIILGMQLLAGFAQMAAYSALFYFIYFCYGLNIRKLLTIKSIFQIIISFIIALIVFYPQFILSLALIKLSGRASASLGFALWGSFSPLNLVTICFPALTIFSSLFYISIFGLIFLIMAILNLKAQLSLRPLFITLIVAIFFALGAYNPIYVFLLKLTRLYAFRNPSKFIFFSIFSASVLSGWGFTEFFKSQDTRKRVHALTIFSIFISFMLLSFSLLRILLKLFGNRILAIGHWYVTHYVFAQPHHRYSLSVYLDKVAVLYNQLLNSVSLSNTFIFASLIFCLLALFIAQHLIKNKSFKVITKTFFISAIFIDIYIFSFYGIGFRGNIKPFSYIAPSHQKILAILKSDREIFRVLPFDITEANMPFWARPNANILAGIDSVALYTPLAQQSYKIALSSWEVVDDSLGLLSPDTKVLEEKQSLLKLLNIKYVISARDISLAFLEKLTGEEGIFLYRFKDHLPRVFFTTTLEGDIAQEKLPYLKIIKYESGLLELEVLSGKKGFLVFCENYYPGWQASVDNKVCKILKIKETIQAVRIAEGEHKVVFKFTPEFR